MPSRLSTGTTANTSTSPTNRAARYPTSKPTKVSAFAWPTSSGVPSGARSLLPAMRNSSTAAMDGLQHFARYAVRQVLTSKWGRATSRASLLPA